FPSEAVTANGKFIPAETLMMDAYCLKCHQDAYKGWFHSAHHFSSFNNRAYLASVRETRQVSLKRDGNMRAARWCAGCHDPVPFFSGEFDDPNYDDVSAPSSQAGITCTVCHSITHVNSTRGNADYTIEEPQHYPFTYSDNPVLQWVNNTLVKAKPEMHKRSMLKPDLHRGSEFCSTCHKVSIPFALNHYKDFLRGQDHYNTYLLSGVSGHGARSFYYPPKAMGRCADCHMNLIPSRDFGARDFDGQGGREIHNHLFLAANTGLASIRGQQDIVEAHAKYLADKKVRVDIFALREGGEISGKLLGPIRPEVPTLKPGGKYLVEVVVRTLGLGHPFSQGTVDSNEIWVELAAKAGDRVIGRSGGIGPDGTVDPYSHFINVYMLDRNGQRIDRRNPQDIFVPLYNKQIPPGAGQVVHFELEVPEGLKEPVALEAKVNYRKFDRTYMDFVFGKAKGPKLPVIVMAKDSVRLPIEGGPKASTEPSPIKEGWQRWNDYGIGLLLEGADKGGQKGELLQAEVVFRKVAELGKVDGWVNLARVYQKEGRIPEAQKALEQASKSAEPAAPWVIAWLTAQINVRNAYLDDAIAGFESVLATRVPAKGFDFSKDFEVITQLGAAQYARAKQDLKGSKGQEDFLRKAVVTYRRALDLDSENVAAHYGLGIAYNDLVAFAQRDFQTAERDINTDTGEREPVPDLERIAKNEEKNEAEKPAATAEALVTAMLKRAATAANDKMQSATRARVARQVRRDVAALVAGPRPEFGSKLEPLYEVVEQLGPAWERETDPLTQAALGQALAATHKTLHALLKPDETAEGRAMRIARQGSPAADLNAQSIVIHSLHRPGAPGIDSSAKTTSTSPASPREPAE
ncbi:MAG TPA: tetratricopeptide repeat protein, partial [Isosphaeraceae bacterium]|nr:tetratricopeptide repeat protein [Isosphaeraceae bacterium]